jgi:DNA-binding PadR family transcriptional regulator
MTKQNYTRDEGQHLEAQILKKMHRRLVKSFMDILVLAEITNAPMSGYDAIAFIHNKFGILVSSGTVYSLLYSLERDGLIKGMWAKRKRVYELTEKGEKTIEAVFNSEDKIKSLISNLLLTH